MTEHKDEKAVEILGSLELDRIIQDFGSTNRYRDINRSLFIVTEI